ncbi:META domain-containing protein [Pseudonocardia sp. TRM90224]|uniref:META domain-containing protein n=1 Tax=Pseudonocardia sp. TRM90224 TaxID=2812678 RepID=UPI001E625945|nr:META domain-containing protein [Pseudonocardia sp. TRM90224]
MKLRLALLAALALLTGACGQPPPAAAAPGISANPDPLQLVGTWTVHDAGYGDGAVVHVWAGRFTVIDDCLQFGGPWRAGWTGDLIAGVTMTSGCRKAVPEWVTKATKVSINGTERMLTGADGTVAARLVASDAPPPEYEPTPASTVTDEVRAEWGRPAPLPQHLRPVSPAALAGRWTPERKTDSQPFLDFATDGTWTGSDGCNRTAGRWIVALDGTLLATDLLEQTLIGCDNLPVGTWLTGARRAGLDGETLVLLAADGTETGRLTR